LTDWLPILKDVAPQGANWILLGMADAMEACVKRASLTSRLRAAHFLGQCAEESDGFHTMREYASGREYEGRRDLGNIYPGDGERFRGRGAIETTGRANYAACSKMFAVDFVSHPELLERFPYAAYSAAFYWATHARCNQGADIDSCVLVTHAVNGGENGLQTRILYTGRAKAALAKFNWSPAGAPPAII
jgi:putative chitinase